VVLRSENRVQNDEDNFINMESREGTVELICSICGLPTACSHPSSCALFSSDPRFQASQPLVSMESTQIKVFDFIHLEWDVHLLAMPTYMDSNSRYLWVDEGLFCSGGMCSLGFGEGKQKALILRRGDWAMTQLADMLIPRLFHGLWWLPARRSVLVFGGKDKIGLGKLYCRSRCWVDRL
jgi:hypothetical protein